MKQRMKLSQEQKQNESLDAHQSHQEQQGLNQKEFATAEELVRFDAKQTEVPPQIAERLKQSLANLPPQPRSWWRRFFQQ
jgi:hypothetical protein